MSKVIEETLKALTEFESQLDVARSEASDAKRQMAKKASEWAEAARTSAMDEAKRMASETVEAARRAAQLEADSIKKKGASELKRFEESLGKHEREAAELVAKRLLGESE